MKRTASLLCVLLGLPVSITAQTFPGTTPEKRPTPQDPQYRPPVTPPYLRKRSKEASPAQQYFANPGAQDDLTRALPAQQPKAMHPFHEARTEEEFRKQQDRTYLERTYLPQFGRDVDPDHHNPFYGEPEYQETPAERFQTISLMSAPFTFGLSYAAMLGYRRGHGWHAGLDGPQTAVVLSTGAILSGLIAWYDYRRVWKSQTIRDLERFARQLEYASR